MPDFIANAIWRPSPNHEERRNGAKVSLVILHYTGMKSGEKALARLTDPASKVSAHYLVEEDGRIFRLVDEAYRAWHAGQSFWRGKTDINSCSIGIEIVNPGHEWGYQAFPVAQMQAVRDLCCDIKQRHHLPAEAFLAHSDIAPLRKEDPGELFDWHGLAQHGIGLWPAPGDAKEMTQDEAMRLLADIGYQSPDAETFPAILKAFQRHYVPEAMTGLPDEKTCRALRALVERGVNPASPNRSRREGGG